MRLYLEPDRLHPIIEFDPAKGTADEAPGKALARRGFAKQAIDYLSIDVVLAPCRIFGFERVQKGRHLSCRASANDASVTRSSACDQDHARRKQCRRPRPRLSAFLSGFLACSRARDGQDAA